ncbi:MAG: hypothetical protein GY810_15380 [Aureispira sp.]|nr:hypothetical protein [Aureispira sp.]
MKPLLFCIYCLCSSIVAKACIDCPNLTFKEITAQEALSYDHIFVAKIKKLTKKQLTYNDHELYLDLDIKEQFRGKIEQNATSLLIEGKNGHPCGIFNYKEGKTYYFFVNQHENSLIAKPNGRAHLATMTAEHEHYQGLYNASNNKQELKARITAVYQNTIATLEYLQAHTNGKLVIKNSQGQISGQGQLQNGQLHGKWTFWDHYKNKTAEGSYRKEQKVGTWDYYRSDYNRKNNKLAERLMYKGSATEKTITYYASFEWANNQIFRTKKTTTKNGKLHGVQYFFFLNKGSGVERIVYYNNGEYVKQENYPFNQLILVKKD